MNGPSPNAARELIGIDLGGTAIKLGRFDLTGALLAELMVPTPQPAMPGATVMAICEAVAQLDPDHRADRIGIGHPGPADAAGRVARIAINLPGWRDVPLADWLEPMLERRVTCANDGNCAVLGEHHSGAARGSSDVLLLTLGTGVGGGVLLGGALFTGRGGAASEPGLIGINPDGPPCNSGNRGSLESFCSLRGLARLSDVPPEALQRRAAAGDGEARAVWQRYGQLLGIGISSLVYVLTPELVLLGGGLSGACDQFLPAVWQEVNTRVQAASREGLQIRRAELGNGAGRLGAALLAAQRLG